MAKQQVKKNEDAINIIEISRGECIFRVVGSSPMICNSMSEKVRQELLYPSRKKNSAERGMTVKHNPLEEYRRSVYRARDPKSPTRLIVPATALKKAIMGAALDTPGSSKAQIGRLVHVVNDQIPVWGLPELHMAVVRQAGINRTPDIRTRAILPEWALEFRVNFAVPMMNAQSIVNLVGAAGLTQGLGDWRVEKGAGSYGQFRMVEEGSEDEALFGRIVAEGGVDAQDAALEDPPRYDSETDALYQWWGEEHERRTSKTNVKAAKTA